MAQTEKESLSEKVYKALKVDLLSGRLNTLEIIIEQDVADKCGVSKTPAREALMQLTMEGFLTKYPRKGYVLKRLRETQIAPLLEARYYLLANYVELIFQRNSDEQLQKFAQRIYDYEAEHTGSLAEDGLGPNMFFYLELAKLIGNEWVYDMNERLLMHFFGCSNQALDHYRSTREESLANRRRIISALLDRNTEELRQAMKSDIMDK